MRKVTMALAALAAASATLFTASAATAVDYSAPVVVIGSGPANGVVGPGEDFTLEGDFGGTECNPWGASFEGQTTGGSGTTFSATFTAPTEPGTYFVNMTCTYETAAEASSSVASTFFFQAEAELAPIPITVAGEGAGDGTGAAADESGLLPDTGGSNLLLLVAGGALVLAGAGVMVARRRQS